MKALRSVRSLFVGLVLGAMVSSAAVAGAAWVVESVEGSAQGNLASLSALKVEPVETEETFWPGDVVPLTVSVDNPNPRALAVRSIDIDDPQSGDELCDRSLTDARTRFTKADIVLEPGEQRVTIGRLTLPDSLAQGCVGRSLKIPVKLTAVFGK